MKPSTDYTLSELQYRLMETLWEQGAATASMVQQALADEKPMALTTVSTMLSRLARRGLLRTEKQGRQVTYSPAVTAETVRRSMVRDMVGTLFGGDARGLVAHLVKDSDIEPGDLDEIRRLLDAEDNE